MLLPTASFGTWVTINRLSDINIDNAFFSRCSSPLPTEGSVLIQENPSKAYPDCCPKYVSPDSPLASLPPLEAETHKPPFQGTDSSNGDIESETEVNSFESFDCCFDCCYDCCVDLLNHGGKHGFDSSEESSESDESDED